MAGEEALGDATTAPPRRWWDRGAVWLVLVAVGVVGSLLAAVVYEGRRAGDLGQAPRDPERFCDVVGELHARGDIEIDVTAADPAADLRVVADGLAELQSTGPGGSLADDLGALRRAMAPVIDRATAPGPDGPETGAALVAALDDQLRPLRDASERVDAYTRRWCGVDLDGTRGPGEGLAPPVGG